MSRILKHEFFKFFNSLTLKILILVIIGMAVLNVAMIIIVAKSDFPGMEMLPLAFNGVGGALQSFAKMSDLSIYMAVIVSVIVVYDINSQTIKNTMICDISRGKIFIAKYIVEITGVSILILINIIMQTGILTIFLGWGETFNFTSFFNNFIIIALMGLILSFALTAFINFFAYLTKNTVIVIVIVFIVILILTIVTYINMAVDSSILNFINNLSLTSVLNNYSADRTFENFMYYILSVSLLFFPFMIGGYLYFQKQEIK